MSDFGDWEPEDSFARSSYADPLAVARRIHEDVGALRFLNGQAHRRWPQLQREEQEIAQHLASEVLTALNGDPSPEYAAVALHVARQKFGDVYEWKVLRRNEQEVAVALMRNLVRWLQLEGSL